MYRRIAFIVCVGLSVLSIGGWAENGESIPNNEVNEYGTSYKNAEAEKTISDSFYKDEKEGETERGDEESLDITDQPEMTESGNLLEEAEYGNGISFNGNEEVDVVSDNEQKEVETVSTDGWQEIEENAINEEQKEEPEVKEETISDNENVSISVNDEEKSVSSDEIGKQSEEDDITKISMPTKVQIHFDPYDLNGKGEIFSKKYQIINYGNRDILLKIKNTKVSCSSETGSYEIVSSPVMDDHSKKKTMNIDIVWNNENENLKKVLNVVNGQVDEYVIYLKAAEYDEHGKFKKLNKGSTGEFYFTGTLNSNPDIQWYDGEIAIGYNYEIINVKEDEIKEEVNKFISENGWNSQALVQ